jgi:hypothetical protein
MVVLGLLQKIMTSDGATVIHEEFIKLKRGRERPWVTSLPRAFTRAASTAVSTKSPARPMTLAPSQLLVSNGIVPQPHLQKNIQTRKAPT